MSAKGFGVLWRLCASALLAFSQGACADTASTRPSIPEQARNASDFLIVDCLLAPQRRSWPMRAESLGPGLRDPVGVLISALEPSRRPLRAACFI